MTPFDLMTGALAGTDVCFPPHNSEWQLVPMGPWSGETSAYKKNLWIRKPSSPKDLAHVNGLALLKFDLSKGESYQTGKSYLFTFKFNNIFEDKWIIGNNRYTAEGGLLGMEPQEIWNKRLTFVTQNSLVSASPQEIELERKLKEVQDALEKQKKIADEQKKKADQLKANLDSTEDQLMLSDQALVAQKRTHQNYISRKGSEIKKLKQTTEENESKLKAETDKLKSEVQSATRRLAVHASSSSGSSGPSFYEFLEQLITDMHTTLNDKINEIHSHAQSFKTPTKKNDNPNDIIAFRFQDQHNQWCRVDNDVFELLLDAYEKKTADVIKYTVYGNQYETKLSTVQGSKDIFEQSNVDTKVIRFLEPVTRAEEHLLPHPSSSTTITSIVEPGSKDEFTRRKMDEILFGNSHFMCNLENELETIKSMLYGNIMPNTATTNRTFSETDDPFILKLSQLVQLHSSMASGFKYVSPDGKKSKSALIIQPDVIVKAFKKASEEKYDFIRLVFHGSSDYTGWFEKSFSLNAAGKNGVALGQGFYMALSDEVAAEYGHNFRGNSVHKFPKGNFMACIAFTPHAPVAGSSLMSKKVDIHRNYSNHRCDANIASRYVDVANGIKHVEHHNALGFNDPTLVVPIGVMIPWA